MITTLQPASDHHAHGNFAGERAFAVPVDVLGGDRDGGCRAPRQTAVANEVNGGATMMSQCVEAATERLESFEKRARLLLRLVHLPIPGDYRAAQGILLSRAIRAAW